MEILWPDIARETDLIRNAPRLEMPVHLFMGRLDRITPLSLVEAWTATLAAPAVRVEVVDQAGHMAPFEAPERFVDFLERVRAEPGEIA